MSEPIMTDQERYDLLGEMVKEIKLDMIKSEINMTNMKRAMTRGKISGTMDSTSLHLNEQQLHMLEAQARQMPELLACAKELQFEAYEKLKANGNNPQK